MVPVDVNHMPSAASAGLLLWSILLIQQQQHILGSVLFAVLVNMKHLYATLAPIYLVYLLRYYCRSVSSSTKLPSCSFLACMSAPGVCQPLVLGKAATPG